MDTCTFIDFMQALKPWLNRDYIQQARFDDKGNFSLMLVDGGQKIYQVDFGETDMIDNYTEFKWANPK